MVGGKVEEEKDRSYPHQPRLISNETIERNSGTDLAQRISRLCMDDTQSENYEHDLVEDQCIVAYTAAYCLKDGNARDSWGRFTIARSGD